MSDEIAETMPRLIGARPRPRLLLVGELPAAIVELAHELAPTVRGVDALDDVHQGEWDVVVTSLTPFADLMHGLLSGRSSLGIRPQLYVFGLLGRDSTAIGTWRVERFDRQPSRTAVGQPNWASSEICTDEGVARHEFFPIDSRDGELADVLERQVLPAVRRRTRYWYFTASALVPEWTPLFADADGRALAARYRRGSGEGVAEAILMPADQQDPCPSLRWALRRWATKDPERFTGLRDWDADERWLTPSELEARNRLSDHRNERARLVARLDQEEAAIIAAAQVGQQNAIQGARRLLTTDDDELVDAVSAALVVLGFGVESMDKDRKTKGALLEDLRVTDPDLAEWVALVEVRGYSGGAKQGDLARIERFTQNYLVETGQLPSARWYIVNQFKDQAPRDRPMPLESNPTEVSEFANSAGAIIDTRTLFRLLHAHERATDEERRTARRVLRERLGVWPLDETAGSE